MNIRTQTKPHVQGVWLVLKVLHSLKLKLLPGATSYFFGLLRSLISLRVVPSNYVHYVML